jgi:hypothetical protein
VDSLNLDERAAAASAAAVLLVGRRLFANLDRRRRIPLARSPGGYAADAAEK